MLDRLAERALNRGYDRSESERTSGSKRSDGLKFVCVLWKESLFVKKKIFEELFELHIFLLVSPLYLAPLLLAYWATAVYVFSLCVPIGCLGDRECTAAECDRPSHDSCKSLLISVEARLWKQDGSLLHLCSCLTTFELFRPILSETAQIVQGNPGLGTLLYTAGTREGPTKRLNCPKNYKLAKQIINIQHHFPVGSKIQKCHQVLICVFVQGSKIYGCLWMNLISFHWSTADV